MWIIPYKETTALQVREKYKVSKEVFKIEWNGEIKIEKSL